MFSGCIYVLFKKNKNWTNTHIFNIKSGKQAFRICIDIDVLSFYLLDKYRTHFVTKIHFLC